MKRFLLFSFSLSLLALAACTDSFKKGGNGLEYKIVPTGSGKTIGYGNYVQLHFTQVYKGDKDTVIGESRDFMPRINVLDSINTPPEYFAILKQLRKGDSLVLRTRADSFYKRDISAMPAFMKKSNYIYTSLKIVNIFVTKAEADSANKAEARVGKPRIFKKQWADIEKEVLGKNKAQLETDDKLIAAFLLKNSINASKTKWGTYIQTITEGAGPAITPADIVSVNYTGKTLDSGRVIDSNTDPKFMHTQPLQLTIGQLGQVMFGWTDALLQLKKGSKAVLYIPSTLAYGKDGRAPEVGPNQNLVFDIEVLTVESEEELLAKQEAEQKKLMDEQQRRADSMINAQPKTNQK
ncbi:MAG: FKBP-type peptidyl-prolyl cis-trans isomerase [Chitinophagaceae bacterium]|nr:FKBP-type peptidyl-prolyl cis-trans isomerase [Chitinophagaceae bacterium]MBL0056767.1 FKBP-type peptidyl-prolyl cis-trans isomerase [Chitinophagaceae bacterium]